MALFKIVVGIDFGTTYSGVSWAIKVPGAPPEAPPDIHVINDWPNSGALNATCDKVPSLISYGLTGQPNSWGYSITPGGKKCEWFKILLEADPRYAQEASQVKSSSELLKEINKTAEEVARDYLRFIWQYTKETFARRLDDDWQTIYSVECVLTVPAIWSEVAKRRTLSAARAAGLPERITLVSEPEAAALTVLKERATEGSLKEGDSFVVCDAGGGTVDLISYKVESLNPFRIKESVTGDGGLCGSIFLDLAFQKSIIQIVGEDQYKRTSPKSKTSMMQDWEHTVKPNFEVNREGTVRLWGVEDDAEHGIDDNEITLQGAMLQTIFDCVCSSVQTLVKLQVDEVSGEGSSVKAVLLVGGFGGNKYLHKYLATCQKQAGIQVLQSAHAWSAICRGATTYGLESVDTVDLVCGSIASVRSRMSRYSYGVQIQCDFDARYHQPQERVFDRLQGKDIARDQMTWFLRRGQQIMDGMEIRHLFCMNVPVDPRSDEPVRFPETLYICDENVPPARREASVRGFCRVEWLKHRSQLSENISTSPIDGSQYWKVQFEVALVPGSATLEFRVYYHGALTASVRADYLDNT